MKAKVYSTKEFSDLTNEAPSTLRYYENNHLLPNVMRDDRGYRIYSQENYEWIIFVQKMKAVNMPLKMIRNYALLLESGESTRSERIDLLTRHQQRLKDERDALDDALDSIEAKLKSYFNKSII